MIDKVDLRKKCSRCQAWKHPSEFFNNRTKEDGLSSECKLCHNAKKIERERIAREQDPKQRKAIEIDDQLLCNYCLKFKDKSAFNKNSTTRTGYSTKCKQCHKEQYG